MAGDHQRMQPIPAIMALLALQLAAAASTMLPRNIVQWNAIPGFYNKTRIWDRPHLDVAITHRGHLSQVQALLKKMNAGQPIVAVAIGSSFVHDFAGCWQPSLQALWDLGIIPNPSLYPQVTTNVGALKSWEGIWKKCSSGGYMEGFMDTLNRTWPHPNHIFVNNGKGGACLDHVAEAACISAYMPKQMDIVVLDTATNVCDPAGAEKILRQLLKMPTQPLVILFSNSRNCQQGNTHCPSAPYDPTKSYSSTQRCIDCISKGHGVSERCANVSEPYTRAEYDDWDCIVRPYQKLAQLYDVPHISIIESMQQMMENGTPERLNMTRLQVQSRIYQDGVHFRKEDLGTLLAADLLVNYLQQAQQALQALPESQQAALIYRLPRSTLYEKARHVFHTRCYGPSMKQALQHLQGISDKDAQAVAQRMSSNSPGDFFAWGDASKQTYASFDSLPELKVVCSEGWKLQVSYTSASGDIKIKPGFVADRPGSVLEFEVNSAFPELAGQKGQLLVTYLTSYDGWGTVQLSCVAGCACNEQTINAATHMKTSLSKIRQVENLTQHTQCHVRLEVLPATTSSGHKFKLVSISVRVEDTMDAHLV